MTLLITSIVLMALSGIPAILIGRRSGEIVSTLLAVTAATIGLLAAVGTLASGLTSRVAADWQLPNAAFSFRLDPLSSSFLLPIFLLGGLASIYGLGYWRSDEQSSAARLRAFMGLLVAGMATVVVANHAILFLLAWEAMAIAAFFLIATEDSDGEVRSAAWMYLIATHVGTLALFALFVMLRANRGTFILGPVAAGTGVVTTSLVLLLAVVGFGFKAGIFPLHFWLPGAHANAPSHVSALLSGAMLKVGIYGIIRTILFLPEAKLWWGGAIVVIGLTTALVAITLAMSQSDMKRTLAYSSIENVGLITVAIGLFVMGRASHSPLLAALALGAAIAHVWSHSLFKGLLFFGAGSVLHATGTRRIDRLGGLLKKMPVTGTTFLIAAAAASALPGLNGFVSEAMIYLGLVREGVGGGVVTLAAAVIALVGALAVACFVRLTGMIFLGSGRTDSTAHAHEASLPMRVPMFVLAAGCLLVGIFPSIMSHALGSVTGAPNAFAPFLAALSVPLQIAAVAACMLTAALVMATRKSRRGPTWDCGYAQPTARMQYTSRSISEWLTSRLLPGFFIPAMRVDAPAGLFPSTASFETTVDEPFADRVLLPVAARWGARAMRLRWMQQGRLPIYLLYIFVTLLGGVVWVVAFPLIGGGR
jgi:formate hydrogenlyase subunit 3/multisubunit Na+/H+ antiporter MnhD subunit